jgi:hypothetical protein
MSPQLEHALAELKDHFNQASAKMDSTVVELLFRERLFKCFLPTELNGLGLSLTETMQVIRECAYINGSLGWLVQIGNGGNYFASCFPEPISKELFSPLSAVIAGSGAPSGSAVKTMRRLYIEWKLALLQWCGLCKSLHRHICLSRKRSKTGCHLA